MSDSWSPERDDPDYEVTAASEYGDLETELVDGELYCSACRVAVDDTGAEYRCPECGEYQAY